MLSTSNCAITLYCCDRNRRRRESLVKAPRSKARRKERSCVRASPYTPQPTRGCVEASWATPPGSGRSSRNYTWCIPL